VNSKFDKGAVHCAFVRVVINETENSKYQKMKKLIVASQNIRISQTMQKICVAVAAFAATAMVSSANATMYQCTAADGKTTFGDQPCAAGETVKVNEKPKAAVSDASYKAAAMVAAEKAAAAAKAALVGTGGAAKPKSKSDAEQPRAPAKPVVSNPVTPTSAKELEEYAIEEAAFKATLFVYIIESLDPACQKMMAEMSALESADARAGIREPSAAQQAMWPAWDANCRSKAKAASDSWPPPGRIGAQSTFGSTPRCIAWVRSMSAVKPEGRVDAQYIAKRQAELQADARRECR
jgi:hypothetical protein